MNRSDRIKNDDMSLFNEDLRQLQKKLKADFKRRFRNLSKTEAKKLQKIYGIEGLPKDGLYFKTLDRIFNEKTNERRKKATTGQ